MGYPVSSNFRYNSQWRLCNHTTFFCLTQVSKILFFFLLVFTNNRKKKKIFFMRPWKKIGHTWDFMNLLRESDCPGIRIPGGQSASKTRNFIGSPMLGMLYMYNIPTLSPNWASSEPRGLPYIEVLLGFPLLASPSLPFGPRATVSPG